MLKRAKHLNGEMNRVAPFENALLLDVIRERNSVDIFHYNKLNLVGKAHVIDFYDIRVRKQSYRFALVSEAAQKFIASRKLGLEDFNRDNSVFLNIPRAVNIRHSAHTDKLKQLIASIELFSYVVIHK